MAAIVAVAVTSAAARFTRRAGFTRFAIFSRRFGRGRWNGGGGRFFDMAWIFAGAPAATVAPSLAVVAVPIGERDSGG